MQILNVFKFERMPKGEQFYKIKQICSCLHLVLNKALMYQNQPIRKWISYLNSAIPIANVLPEWKKELR